jgi:hypothetical protein
MYISEASKSFNGVERKMSTENLSNSVSISSLVSKLSAWCDTNCGFILKITECIFVV